MEPTRKILIIDDSEISLEMEKFVLEARGHQVATAMNLVEFDKRLKAFQPELILVDVEMPDIPGNELVRILKQSCETDRIPIVLFSAKPDEELALLAERSGADGHLSKSNGIERLGEMVDELVRSIIW
ncbi:response regulator [Vulgatibacter incomptus]|uniref:Response regulator receiver protein n=1 Tax=Vulgatibacter incomptus TaxID=1391653 RepID=A0A0K1PFW6_9BACT|nr:response regulator [Vulgatibacter incomptus]AKU92410.1 response regulator receiver protein [Vulgatibacter incomptus]